MTSAIKKCNTIRIMHVYLCEDPVRYDNTGADKKTERNNRIYSTLFVEIGCERPGGGIGVVRLNRRTTP